MGIQYNNTDHQITLKRIIANLKWISSSSRLLNRYNIVVVLHIEIP